MNNGPRTTAKDSRRRTAELAARPVLARLPDVSAEVQLLRTEHRATGNVGYRFDPPQGAEQHDHAVYAERSSRFPTLKSELIYAPRTSRPQRPHVFERTRGGVRSPRTTRRESPILPSSNPFAIPRQGILDTLAPFLRFATLVTLFTAAGIWIQAVAFERTPPTKPVETPRATAQEPTNPATKTAERPAATSTSATGPSRATPETNQRLGRETANTFARLRGDIMPLPTATNDTNGPMPELASASGELPRVQTAEPPPANDAGNTIETPEVARIPSSFTPRRPSQR